MKIIDCFPFFNEFLLLDVRVAELDDVVDKFVIVESAETFTGVDKPLYLSECIKTRYAKYADKIHLITVPKHVPDLSSIPDGQPVYEPHWHREFFQKNHISKENLSSLSLADDDIIIYGDADEITKNSAVRDIKEGKLGNEGGRFGGPTYYYKFNLVMSWQRPDRNDPELSHKTGWVPYRNFTNFNSERESGRTILPNSMWHFSYLMSAEDIKTKMESFSHQEFRGLATMNHIVHALDNNKDVLSRPGIKFTAVEIDETFPRYVKENKDLLKQWIAE